MTVGILPSLASSMSQLSQSMTSGKLTDLQPGQYKVVLGDGLATELGVMPGESVTLFTPQVTHTPLGLLPRYRQLHLAGIFTINSGFGFENGVAYVHFADAMALYRGTHAVSGLQLTVKDLFKAPQVAQQLRQQLPNTYFVSDWTEQFGAFFHAIAMEKTIMFVILILLIAIAVFNLVASLVMLVNEKRSDIAVLRTLGATPGMILRIFIGQGFIVGLIGTTIGTLLGIVLAVNATAIVDGIQQLFHVQFIQASVFFGIDYLPSKLQPVISSRSSGLA